MDDENRVFRGEKWKVDDENLLDLTQAQRTPNHRGVWKVECGMLDLGGGLESGKWNTKKKNIPHSTSKPRPPPTLTITLIQA